jgi:hypothetical protein
MKRSRVIELIDEAVDALSEDRENIRRQISHLKKARKVLETNQDSALADIRAEFERDSEAAR